jgi:cyclic beta-1,2-glucan synthetase
MLIGTLALTHWFVADHGFPSAHIWRVLITLFALLPASEAVIAIVNRLISESVPPRRLPRLALADGIPAEHSVLVVVPSMLTGSAEIHTLAQRLERHYLANSEQNAQFALLTDYADADEMSCAGDADLLTRGYRGDRLAGRGTSQSRRAAAVLLLHRERRWCESEQRWIGWERKRGKLMQLIDWLATGGSSTVRRPWQSFAAARRYAYIVTLDSDTGHCHRGRCINSSPWRTCPITDPASTRSGVA